MEFKVNVHKGREIEKTYIAKEYDLMMGTAEDILAVIDIEKLNGDLESEEAQMEIIKVIIKSFKTFGPMIQEIFPDLTDDEYRRVPVKDVAKVVVQVLKCTVSELFNASSKN